MVDGVDKACVPFAYRSIPSASFREIEIIVNSDQCSGIAMTSEFRLKPSFMLSGSLQSFFCIIKSEHSKLIYFTLNFFSECVRS